MTNEQIKSVLIDKIKELESRCPVNVREVVAELLKISRERCWNLKRIEMGIVMDKVMKDAGLGDIWEVFTTKFWEE